MLLHALIDLQVPADGVLISGHSLAINESSMTGESKIVSVDKKKGK
jgi:Ca2+-transporting ATPase